MNTRASSGILFDNNIQGNNITNNYEGITTYNYYFAPQYVYANIRITRNSITGNKNNGITLHQSSNDTILKNDKTKDSNGGVELIDCSNVLFMGNNVAENGVGINLHLGPNSTFSENNIANNRLGVAIDSSGSRFFHNNFMNNNIQVDASWSSNTWDDEYPSGGNYWSDYTGTDTHSGFYQTKQVTTGLEIPPKR